MSRRHSGLVTSAVTLETLRFHCLNSHVKQRLHTARTNTSESVLTLLILISKHYKSISCLSPVLLSNPIRTLFLTLAPARSGQIGSVSPPQPSISLRSRSDLAQIQPILLQKSSRRTYLNTLKTTVLLLLHFLRTLKHTAKHSMTQVGLWRRFVSFA